MKTKYNIIIGIVIFIVVTLSMWFLIPEPSSECPWHYDCPVCITSPCPCPCEKVANPIKDTSRIWAPLLIGTFATAVYTVVTVAVKEYKKKK